MKYSAINEDKMEKLKLDLLDDIEKLNSIFNQMDTEMETIKQNLIGAGNAELTTKFELIKANYPIIKKNITNYATDIQKVIDSYRNQDQELNEKIISDIEKLE